MSQLIEHYLQQMEKELQVIDEMERIQWLNVIRSRLSELSPFKNEPVDCVLWLPARKIRANDYNPNVMSPSEQRLLYTSLLTEGYTQPVVVAQSSKEYNVVDGYHRMQHGKHKPALRKRLKGFLPVVVVHEIVVVMESGARQRSDTIVREGNIPSSRCQTWYKNSLDLVGTMNVLLMN